VRDLALEGEGGYLIRFNP